MMTRPLSQEKTNDRLPIRWIKKGAVTGGKKRKEDKDKIPPAWDLIFKSVGSLMSDKNIVNRRTEETPAWALCLHETDRAASVRRFVGIYSKDPCLTIMVRQNPNRDWDLSVIASHPCASFGARVSAGSFIYPVNFAYSCAGNTNRLCTFFAWRVSPGDSIPWAVLPPGTCGNRSLFRNDVLDGETLRRDLSIQCL